MTEYNDDCADYILARATVATFIEDLRGRVPAGKQVHDRLERADAIAGT